MIRLIYQSPLPLPRLLLQFVNFSVKSKHIDEKEGAMMKVGNIHHILAYLAVAVSVVSVILAGISRLMMQTLGITTGSYMSLATVAILFAIYFLVEGAVCSAKKAK